jgi:hypothetical protein
MRPFALVQGIPKNRAEAQRLLFDYIETFYNSQRLRSALGYLSAVRAARQRERGGSRDGKKPGPDHYAMAST